MLISFIVVDKNTEKTIVYQYLKTNAIAVEQHNNIVCQECNFYAHSLFLVAHNPRTTIIFLIVTSDQQLKF